MRKRLTGLSVSLSVSGRVTSGDAFNSSGPRSLSGRTIQGIAIHTGVPLPPERGLGREQELEAEGRRLLRAALREFGAMVRAGDESDSERRARHALELAVDAYNCLEDTTSADWCHQWIHTIGAFVAANFGCAHELSEGLWFTRCPVVLVHLRVGLSVGFTATRVCSICRLDIMECDHILGRQYAVGGGQDAEGICRVCAIVGCREHREGVTYPVTAHPLVISVDELREISLVPRPRDPLARVQAVSLLPAEVVRYRPAQGECPCAGGCPGFKQALDLISGAFPFRLDPTLEGSGSPAGSQRP